MQPFQVDVPPSMLDDLAARLARTRWPLPPVPGGGEPVEMLDRIAELIAFWRDGYDWPAAARRLNAAPHYLASVGGVGLLTNVMVYWVTGSIGSSTRLYTPDTARLSGGDVVRVPASVLAPHEPKLPVPPESWLRRGYPDLRRFVPLDRGGHFLAAESPERFVAEIREAFRPYRMMAA